MSSAALLRLSTRWAKIVPRMTRMKFFPRQLIKKQMKRSASLSRRSMLYGSVFCTAFFLSSYIKPSPFRSIASDHDEEHFHLLDNLRILAPKIDAKKMLKLFLKEFNQEGHDHVTIDFVIELFEKCGIDDPSVATHLFHMMDWNNNGKLEPVELVATFTLFQVGNDQQRFKFLFHCLDLDQSHGVDKDEFRAFLTSLLEAKYHLSGLRHYRDPDELYYGITVSEYRTIAKIKSNALVREIFLFADTNRDGVLNMKEFLHWCQRGGHQVAVLKDLLHHVVDEALYHDHGHGVGKVGF